MASVASGALLRQIHDLFDGGNVAGQGDGPLLERFLARRDPAAFETLVARHGPMVLRICRATLTDPNSAEDAFQATFLVLIRKAGSIRGRDALGPWLGRVARRVAVEANRESARRRARERPGVESRAVAAPSSGPREELRAAVLEEIARLPERVRRPLVLCHLEAKSHAEAAVEMRVGEATVRRRIARARDLLRSRLTRRGVTATAGALAAALASRSATAAVPRTWAAATVRAAVEMTGGRAQVGAAAMLAGRVARPLAMVRPEGIAAAAILGICSWTAWGLVNAGEPPRKAAARAIPPAPLERPNPIDVPPSKAEVRGLVVDGQGKPVEGARVLLVVPRSDESRRLTEPVAETTAGRDGRFNLKVPTPGPEAADAEGWRTAQVVATAVGFGPTWVSFDPGRTDEVTLRMVADDVPISGRVLDLEGRPVAAARVVVHEVATVQGGDLSPYLKTVRLGTEDGNGRLLDSRWYGAVPGRPGEVTTGADGRFTLAGFGRERLVELAVEAPSIQSVTFLVMTRAAGDVGGPGEKSLGSGAGRVHGATFDLLVVVGRSITGVVRDKATKRPIPGMYVGGMQTNARTTTDVNGRFTVTGFPKARNYDLLTSSHNGLPYFVTVSRVVDTAGLSPIAADLECVRGIPYRLKVLDAATGRPVVASVTYYPLYPNPRAKDVPGFAPINGWGATGSGHREPDGTYTGGVLPGPGALCVSVAGKLFRPACVDPRAHFGAAPDPDGTRARKLGIGRAANPEDEMARWYGTREYLMVDSASNGAGQAMPQSQFQGIVLTNAPEGSGPLTLEVRLERERVRAGTVVGPDGRPVDGAVLFGLTESSRKPSSPLPSPDFRVEGLNPLRPRRLTAFHEGRKLAGFLVVTGDEAGPYRLELKPWASLAGRLVDAQGRPRGGVELLSTAWRDAVDRDNSAPFPETITTDADGRFRYERLVPGLRYEEATIRDRKGVRRDEVVIEDAILGPGEARDLGDVRSSPRPQ